MIIPSNIEIYDPENPPIYYYTNGSTKKPVSVSKRCKKPRTRTSSRLMLVLAFLYIGYLFYLSFDKPQFAVDYAKDQKRKTIFAKQNVQLSASLSIIPLQNKGMLLITFQNLLQDDNVISIKKATYRFSKTDIPQTLSVPQSLALDAGSRTSIPIELPLETYNRSKELGVYFTLTLDPGNGKKAVSRAIWVSEK